MDGQLKIEGNGRLIVVSNRLPKGDVPSGGLIFALHEALTEIGGLWVGAADPTTTASDGLTDIGGDKKYDLATFELTHKEHKQYYLGYSNSVLWPLFHHRPDLLEIHAVDFEAYTAVNRRVARSIAAVIEPEDTIWVHDYHFLMLGKELRDLGVENRIGVFLHIPFPNASDVMALPESQVIARWLAAFDLVGLQTMRDVIAARDVLLMDPKVHILNDGSWVREDRHFRVRSYPIGIDARAFAKTARNAKPLELQLAPDAPLLLGVDRLDYSKGLVHRFHAFDSYLSARDAAEPRPTFLQIAPCSREDVIAYQEIREELEQAAGSINGAHADLDWTPLRYVRRHIDRDVIAGLYRRADVALVTPLADGMNLVAKEYVAAQDPEDPGVLILSHFAGAAEQMQQALLVNPFDADGFAEAIREAVNMPLDERKERHAALLEVVMREDINWWTSSYLASLRRTPTPVRMKA